MLKNYFKIAFRNLLRNKSYTFINVAGLALGITTCIIIFIIIKREVSYDQAFSNSKNIYRIVRETTDASGVEKTTITPYPLAEALKNDFPDLISTQFHFQEDALMTIAEEKSRVTNIMFADPSFFEVFDIEVLSGNPKKDLADPGKVYLTEEFAETLLKKDVKNIKLENLLDLEVAGIIRMPSTPTHISVNMIVSRATLTPDVTEQFLGFSMDQWGLNASGFAYVVLPASETRESMEAKFPAFIKKYYQAKDAERQTFLLQPLSEIHFDTEFSENPGTTSTNSSTLIVLAFIGVFILLVACVNFINLSTALSVHKSKEVGVRKTLGAQRYQLTWQYLSEAFLITLCAGIISVGIAEGIAPLVGNFLERDVQLNLLDNPQLIIFLVVVIFVTALFSGFYPALVLSKFNPVKALKNRMSTDTKSPISVRKILVVGQFFIAQVLIICTLVVSSQLSFFRNSSLGFSKEAVINVSIPDNSPTKLAAFRNRLEAINDIKGVSFSLGAPMSDNKFGTDMYLTDKGESDRYSIRLKLADAHYKDVYGLELLEGRWFLESDEKLANLKGAERQWSYLLNEEAVRILGFSSPKDIIGKNITIGFNDISGSVIGVVKDFHTESLQHGLESVVLLPFNYFFDAGIKINTANAAATIKNIEQAWQEQFSEYLFQYSFLDDYVGRLYREEERMFGLFEVFACIAIFIGCLGLYGLASFMAQQKTKEIAIRKTLGASVTHIVALFSRDFVLLVVIAFVLAVPVAWYAMNLWLEDFAFKVEITWVVFAIGILSTLAITFITVGYRSLRAAIANPVDALKSE